MFQRLKGAIDSTIAQEQARQRSALTSPPPSSASRKPSSRAESPAKRALRPHPPSRQHGEASGKGPDPAEFEPEFVIDDSDVPSRSGTPGPTLMRSESSTQIPTQEATEEAKNVEGKPEEPTRDGSSAAPQELPTDVRVKLRKLEKLESRYHELLRSYRLAHSRVQTIDSFEASLRESTPLTSINDPRALVEYLNQLNLKGDMVLDELKRVSHDRDTYKNQLSDAEKRAKEAWDEVANLRQAKDTGEENGEQSQPQADTPPTEVSLTENSKTEQSPLETANSPSHSAKSRTGSLPSLSIFSPKPKQMPSPVIKETQEDLFSYDDEIPRLQSEVKDRDGKIEKLQTEVTSLQGDLAVTRESTQSMVQTLEEATRELNSLRDFKDRSAAELEEQREASSKLSDKLHGELSAAELKLKELETVAKPGDTARLGDLEKQLEHAEKELGDLRRDAKMSESQTSEVQSLQSKITSLEQELHEARAVKEQGDKRAETVASLMKSLRDQLAESERKHAVLCDSKGELEQTLQDRIHRLEQDLEQRRASLDPAIETGGPTENTLDTAATSGKKKNKKKKKGGKPTGDQAKMAQSSQNGPITIDTSKEDQLKGLEDVTALEDELQQCRQRLEEKDAALQTMRSKLEDQDDLKEEIESLRDDIINVGQGHVQAKDKVKELQEEKQALQGTVINLEKELAEMKGSHAIKTTTSDQKHQDLASQIVELKNSATTLQTDLSAAQQLASSRFKELSELRTVMQKAQPELTSLRKEVNELRSIKEAHDEKATELKKLESRQEDMRSEIETQKRMLAERGAEIKNINQKLSQESGSRSRADDARKKASEEIQRLENEKKQASESLDKLSRDLAKARDESSSLRSRVKDVEQQILALKRDNEGLKEEIDLKAAQHASAESLMSSMRDQTTEMAVQMKEARDRCESLDEEIADAHRLLNERSREGETMRRLLADIEGKADARTREMKDRMETAIEERDRAEDEASSAARRRARELDELRNKVRESERSLKRAEEEKEELEFAQRDWKRRREELERRSEQSTQEAEEVRRAMGELRDALDESERQVREAEKQKAEIRRGMDDTQHRLERLEKSNKVRPTCHEIDSVEDLTLVCEQSMADEVRKLQAGKGRAVDSEAQSSRSSTDSAPIQARLASPTPGGRASSTARPGTPNGQASGSGSMDFVYLKNVLLQFLEQKDRNHQKQLIPVLGMLLHFDRYVVEQTLDVGGLRVAQEG
ncbi:MAG: hypothetical protein LQ345_003004 [Seirophora villosa]|nr:MAG: hypothetical protein LQ345_003004 [Seirophora villosa]